MRVSEGVSTTPKSGGGFRFAIVVSRFNSNITESLRRAARRALEEAQVNAADVEEFSVPGAFELPQAARCAAETSRFDAIITLGCVIRGETPHFEYVSAAATQGIMAAAGETGVPIALGVLTTDTEAQALARAGDDADNKGREAAAAAIEMAALFRTLGRPPARSSTHPFGFGPGSGER